MIIVSDTTPISELADEMQAQGTRISDRLYEQVLILAGEMEEN